MKPKKQKNTGGINYAFYNTAELRDSQALLMKYKAMWDALLSLRQRRQRNIDYYFGRIWEGRIYDHETGCWIKEEDFIKKQGRTPFTDKMVRRHIKSLLGVYRSNKTKPLVNSRDRAEQSVNEMMNIALEYASDINNLSEKFAQLVDERTVSAVVIMKCDYLWKPYMERYDLDFEAETIAIAFFNNFYKSDGSDISSIGFLRDLPLTKIIKLCGNDRVKIDRVIQIYGECKITDENYYYSVYDSFDRERFKNLDFFVQTEDLNLCRIIEAWELESEVVIKAHDYLTADYSIRDKNSAKEIDAENELRTAEALAQGVAEEDIKLIEYEYDTEDYWYYRYFTPSGYIVKEGRSEFKHKHHPYRIQAYPMLNGEVLPFAEEMIDEERQKARLLSQIDYMIGTSSKGDLVIAKESLGNGAMTLEEVIAEKSKANGVYIVNSIDPNTKMKIELPRRDYSSPNIAAALNMAQFYIQQAEHNTGISQSLQGQTAQAGTPAARYAQETQNASNNLVDFLESFTVFKKEVYYTALKLIQQYYTTPRYLNIAGNYYSEEAKNFDPNKVKNLEFDVSITESPSSPVFRQRTDELLTLMLGNPIFQQYGFDPFVFLRNSSIPQTDNIARQMEQNLQKAESGELKEAPKSPQGA